VSDQTLTEKIRNLPPEKVAEVEAFVDFLEDGQRRSAPDSPVTKLSQDAFAKVWDNPDDADYDRL